jgi:hypothetical protein
MTRRAALAAALIASSAAACCGASAKEKTMSVKPEPTASRAPPPRVAPVFIAGVRYAQAAGEIDTDGQKGGILAAYDASNRELWRLRLYENVRIPGLEGDVQDVYFRSMRADGSRLLIENERGERFEVDTATRHVVGHAASAPAPKADVDPITGRQRLRPPED